MRILLILLLFTTISSCATKNSEREVALFNDIKFNLLEGEKIVEVNPKIKDSFQAHFGHYPFQLPLYKYAEKNGYRIFIALPYNIPVQKLVKYHITEQDSALTEIKTDSSTYYFKRYKDSSNYVSEYVVSLDNNLVYLFSLTPTKAISDSVFNYIALSQRFSQSKK